jgi:hypothetical protein
MFKLFRKEKPSIKVVTKTSRSPISPISSKLAPQTILFTEYIKNIINNEQINIGLELLNNTELSIYRKTKLYNLLVINNIKKEQLKYASEPDPFFWSRICKIIRDMKFITSDNSTCTIGEFIDDNSSNNEARYKYDQYNEIEINPGVKITNSVDNIKAIKTVLTNMMNNPYKTINNFLSKEIDTNQINTLFSEYIQEIYGFNKSNLKSQPSKPSKPSKLMKGGANFKDVVLFIDAYQNPNAVQQNQTVCLFYGKYNEEDYNKGVGCTDYKTVIDNCLRDLNKCIQALQQRPITNIFELIDYFIDSINSDSNKSKTTIELLDFIIKSLYGIEKTDYLKSKGGTDRRMLADDTYKANRNLIKKMFSLKETQEPLDYYKTFNDIDLDYTITSKALNGFLDNKNIANFLPKKSEEDDEEDEEEEEAEAEEEEDDDEEAEEEAEEEEDDDEEAEEEEDEASTVDGNDLLKAFYDLIEIKESVKCLITKSDKSDNFDKKNAIDYMMEKMSTVKQTYNTTIKRFKQRFEYTFEDLKLRLQKEKNKDLEELPMYKWIASLFDAKEEFGRKFINYIILYYKNRLEEISDKKEFDINLTGTCYILNYENEKYNLADEFDAVIVYDYINKNIKKITSTAIKNLKILKTYISISQFLLDNQFKQKPSNFFNQIKLFFKADPDLPDLATTVGSTSANPKSANPNSANPNSANLNSAYKNLIIKLLIKQENKNRINHNILEQSKIGELLCTTKTLKSENLGDLGDITIFNTITSYF